MMADTLEEARKHLRHAFPDKRITQMILLGDNRIRLEGEFMVDDLESLIVVMHHLIERTDR